MRKKSRRRKGEEEQEEQERGGRSRSLGQQQTKQEEGANSPQESNNDKLMVALRIRPLKREEISRGYKAVANKVDDKMVLLATPDSVGTDHLRQNRNQERQYIFDTVFGPDSTQEEVYTKTTKHLVENVLNGYNATVFAYGATGGGKTYTMVGQPDNPGIMVRALNHLFTAMQEVSDSVHKVTMSYLEIYNENIRDLLDPASGYLELRDESRGKNIQVTGLSEVTTASTEEVMRLLTKGNKERTQEPTKANQTSSRSHALLMVNVKQTSKSRADTKGAVKHGRLYMIDLAGSERAANTQNTGQRLKEGAAINRSLLALGNCINALAEKKTKYVNYRDSKLTRLLKEALSGNCHTVMIAHISPADKHRDESRNTLVYADRAKNISNKVRRNVLDVSFHVGQYQSIISELRGEIGRLKEKINNDPGGTSDKATKQQMEELKILRDALVANFRDQMKLRHRVMEIDNHILGLTMEFERQNIIVTEWETEKAKNKSDRLHEKGKKRRSKKKQPKIVLESDSSENGEERENEDEESGFEDNEGAAGSAEEDYEEETEEEEERRRVLYNNTDSEHDSSDLEDVDEPEDVKRAWEELMIIQREQQRYSDIKQDIAEELEGLKEDGSTLENELPQRTTTAEEKEILSLLCKVHELEIDKVEMKSETLLKSHEVRRRDLLILKYDKQRNLCDEIITRQQKLIEDMEDSKANNREGNSMPMPDELMELYSLYQQELNTRHNEKETHFLSELNTMLRSPSMLSLRGPEFEDRGGSGGDKLPPIRQEQDGDELFQRAGRRESYPRMESRLSMSTPESAGSQGARPRLRRLPGIDSDREESASDKHSGSSAAQDRRRRGEERRRREEEQRRANPSSLRHEEERRRKQPLSRIPVPSSSRRPSLARSSSLHFPPIAQHR